MPRYLYICSTHKETQELVETGDFTQESYAMVILLVHKSFERATLCIFILELPFLNFPRHVVKEKNCMV